ncbi:hypothetical protein FRC09_009891, partial [Ceratobasidium sp. 395]
DEATRAPRLARLPETQRRGQEKKLEIPFKLEAPGFAGSLGMLMGGTRQLLLILHHDYPGTERNEFKGPTVDSQDSLVALHKQSVLPPLPTPHVPVLLPAITLWNAKFTPNGTWHVDASLKIPNSLPPPTNEFDGRWNKRVQTTRKAREQGEGKKTGQTQSPIILEVRLNLMLVLEYGSVREDVNAISSDDSVRQAAIVTETRNGPTDLAVNHSPEQSLRIYAYSTYGTVKIWIPSSFNGALIISPEYGKIKISDGIKAKLTTFSTTSKNSRCFVGDWQSSGFGKTPSPSQASDLATESILADPFFSRPGSFVKIGSRNCSVSLSLIEEKVDSSSSNDSGKPSRGLRSFVSGLFGRSGHETANPSVDALPLEKTLPPFPGPRTSN